MKLSLSFLTFIFLRVFSLQQVNAQNWSWALSSEYKKFDAVGASYTNASGISVFCGSYTDSIKVGAVKLRNEGAHRFFIAVADADGNVLNVFSDGEMDLSGEAYIYDVTLDQQENIIIAGIFYNSPISFHGVTHPCIGPEELFIAKYTRDGNFQWVKTFGSTTNGGDILNKIITDESNNIYTTGFFGESDLDLGAITLANTGNQNTFLSKYDGDGNLLWAKTAVMQGNSMHRYARGTCIALKSDAVYWLGIYYGAFTIGGQTIGSVDAMDDDVYIVSLTRDGEFNWVKKDGGVASDDYARNAFVLADTMLLVTGYYQGLTSSFAGQTVRNTPDNAQVNTSYYIAAYHADATGKWAKPVLVPGTNQSVFSYGNINGMVLDKELNVWLTGVFRGEIMVGNELQYSINSSADIFMIKYNTRTGEQIELIKTGNEKTDYASSLGIDACDQLYCFGFYRDSLYVGNHLLYNPTVNSAFLAKYETNTNCNVTSVDALKTESVFLLAPNPAHEQVQLNLPENISQDYSVSIYNAMGQEEQVYTIHSFDRQMLLPLAVKPGIYVVQLIAAGKRYTSKLIVE